MTRITRGATLGIVLAALSLSAGYAAAGHGWGIAVWLAAGALWRFVLRRRARYAAPTGSLLWTLFTVGAAVGIWLGAWPGAMLAGVGGALIAWDLHALRLRLHGDEAGFVKPHLRRLVFVAGGGLLLGSSALALRFELGLLLAIGLGLLAVLGLGQAVRE